MDAVSGMGEWEAGLRLGFSLDCRCVEKYMSEVKVLWQFLECGFPGVAGGGMGRSWKVGVGCRGRWMGRRWEYGSGLGCHVRPVVHGGRLRGADLCCLVCLLVPPVAQAAGKSDRNPRQREVRERLCLRRR